MSIDYLPARKYFWGEHINVHHQPDQRAEMVNCQPAMMVTMPEVGPDLYLKHSGVEQVSYPMVRAWLFEDDLPPGSTPDAAARRYVDALLEQRAWILEAGERALAKGKRFGVLITNEYFPTEPERVKFFGDFSVSVLELLHNELPGVWGIVGNWPMGNITQAWWDLFFTPRLEAALRAGLGALGIHEYGYVHPASLMRYQVPLQDEQNSYLEGSFMPGRWPVPIPDPFNLIEAHLIGRTFDYVSLPRWIPVFVTECGMDAVSVQQAKDWGAPYRQAPDGGPDEAFSGVNTLKPLLQRTWQTNNGVLFYVQEYLPWLAAFYGQWPQVFGVAHFATGNNYGQFEEHDLGVENEVGAGRLRQMIADSEMENKVAAWSWAEFVLANEPAPPPPTPPPDDGNGGDGGELPPSQDVVPDLDTTFTDLAALLADLQEQHERLTEDTELLEAAMRRLSSVIAALE